MMKQLGRGRTAEIYEWGINSACKLFFENYPESSIQRERQNAELVNQLSWPAPKVYGTEHIGSRTGLIYDRLFGHDLLTELLRATSFESVASLIREFALLHQQLLTTHSTQCENYRQWMLRKGQELPLLEQMVCDLPEGDCVCHGDFHPGNVWRNQDGTLSVLDFMNVCHGPAAYDVARTYFLLTESDLPGEEKKIPALLCQKSGEIYLACMGLSYQDLQIYLAAIQIIRTVE